MKAEKNSGTFPQIYAQWQSREISGTALGVPIKTSYHRIYAHNKMRQC
jgi:hypothetical protein